MLSIQEGKDPVARELAPAGLRGSPLKWMLRAQAGASSLATMLSLFPVTSLLAPARWLYRLEWRRGFFDWARSDGVTWVYIFKVLFAAFLTLWLAMRLELPQPRTAMITVFIVMQPQSGQVFAKSFYRFLGTLAGSAVMVALIADRKSVV